MAASHYKLGNLVAIVDANGFSGSGPTSLAMNIEPLGKRFEAFGWRVQEIDGHDIATLKKTFDELPDAATSEQPIGGHRQDAQGARRRVHGEAAAGLAPRPAQPRAVRRRGRGDHRADGANGAGAGAEGSAQ